MSTIKKNKIIKTLFEHGYFSEYLPIEFSTIDFTKLKSVSMKSTNTKPYFYTMNKNDTFIERRTISIPEVGSYINAVKYIESNTIIDDIISITDSNENSLSKLFTKGGKVRAFANPYLEPIPLSEKIVDTDDFITNTIVKLKKSFGSEGILKLDIANFYGSFYTHNIACIGHDQQWAEEKYQGSLDGTVDSEYKALKGLDTCIGQLNQKRTHGLLIGSLLSYIIAEGLMATIDLELTKELTNVVGKSIGFIRFMDDYDVFIKNEKDIPLIVSTFTKVLEKYGFVLSDSKTEYKKFPFYVYENFSEILNVDESKITSKDLLNIYSKLANYETQKIQKGGLYYLSTNIAHLSNKSNFIEVISLLISTMKVNAKSIPTSCRSILNVYHEHKSEIDEKILFNNIYDFLFECINKKYEWEEVWLIYTLIKIDSTLFSSVHLDLIKNGLTELSLIIIANELTLSTELKISLAPFSTKKSWLLNYELFRLDIIDEDLLRATTSDNDLVSNFILMKSKSIVLYHKYEKKGEVEPPFI